MFIDENKRAEALGYLRSGEQMTPPFNPPGLLSTHEAKQEFLNEIKPEQYMALALVVGELVDKTIETPLAEVPFTVPTYGREFKPIEKLESQSLALFSETIGSLSETQQFRQAETFTFFVGGLDPNRFKYLNDQLYAGASTAARAMLGLLRVMPAIIAHHAPDIEPSPDQLHKIARRSTGLPWKLAMMSVEQMMAARELTIEKFEETEDSTEPMVDAAYFDLHWRRGQIISIHWNDIGNIEVPAGYEPLVSQPPLPEALPLHEYRLGERATIGCPVTLLPEKFNKLWNWFIEGVIDADVWQ